MRFYRILNGVTGKKPHLKHLTDRGHVSHQNQEQALLPARFVLELFNQGADHQHHKIEILMQTGATPLDTAWCQLLFKSDISDSTHPLSSSVTYPMLYYVRPSLFREWLHANKSFPVFFFEELSAISNQSKGFMWSIAGSVYQNKIDQNFEAIAAIEPSGMQPFSSLTQRLERIFESVYQKFADDREIILSLHLRGLPIRNLERSSIDSREGIALSQVSARRPSCIALFPDSSWHVSHAQNSCLVFDRRGLFLEDFKSQGHHHHSIFGAETKSMNEERSTAKNSEIEKAPAHFEWFESGATGRMLTLLIHFITELEKHSQHVLKLFFLRSNNTAAFEVIHILPSQAKSLPVKVFNNFSDSFMPLNLPDARHKAILERIIQQAQKKFSRNKRKLISLDLQWAESQVFYSEESIHKLRNLTRLGRASDLPCFISSLLTKPSLSKDYAAFSALSFQLKSYESLYLFWQCHEGTLALKRSLETSTRLFKRFLESKEERSYPLTLSSLASFIPKLPFWSDLFFAWAIEAKLEVFFKKCQLKHSPNCTTHLDGRKLFQSKNEHETFLLYCSSLLSQDPKVEDSKAEDLYFQGSGFSFASERKPEAFMIRILVNFLRQTESMRSFISVLNTSIAQVKRERGESSKFNSNPRFGNYLGSFFMPECTNAQKSLLAGFALSRFQTSMPHVFQIPKMAFCANFQNLALRALVLKDTRKYQIQNPRKTPRQNLKATQETDNSWACYFQSFSEITDEILARLPNELHTIVIERFDLRDKKFFKLMEMGKNVIIGLEMPHHIKELVARGLTLSFNAGVVLIAQEPIPVEKSHLGADDSPYLSASYQSFIEAFEKG